MERLSRPFPSRSGNPERSSSVSRETRRAIEKQKEFKRSPRFTEKDVKEMAREMIGPNKKAYVTREDLRKLKLAKVMKRGETGISAEKLRGKIVEIEKLGKEGTLRLRVKYRRGDSAYPKAIVRQVQKQKLESLAPKDTGPGKEELAAQRRVEAVKKEFPKPLEKPPEKSLEPSPPEVKSAGEPLQPMGSPVSWEETVGDGPSPIAETPAENAPASDGQPLVFQGGSGAPDAAPAVTEGEVPQVFFNQDREASTGSGTDDNPEPPADDDSPENSPPSEPVELQI